MRAKFFRVFAGVFALLVDCAVANAITKTTNPETEPINLATSPTVTFQVITGEGTPPQVTTTNNGPSINSSPLLTFNKFDTSLGTLTGVTITLTTTYGAIATVSATNDELVGTDDFFADATIDHVLTGSLISNLSSQQKFSASCSPTAISINCSSGPVPNNNIAFNGTAGLAVALTSFAGPGTFDLTATLTSALAPRPRDAVDNSTGTLQANWNGSVSVVYTYDDGVAAVPEPLSLYLLAAGLGGIALSRRRR